MRILDCFPFFNEDALLEFRLKLYWQHIDQFIITEADRTFTGNKKPFVCKQLIRDLGYGEALERGKIVVVEVIMPEEKMQMLNSMREHLQRDQAAPYITDDAVAFITDIDEIVDPDYINFYAQAALDSPERILHLPMDWLHGRPDLLMCYPDGSRRAWQAGFVCLKQHVDTFRLSRIREHVTFPKEGYDLTTYPPVVMNDDTVNPKGWHFNWIGDNDAFTTKWINCTHYDDYIHGSPYANDQHAMTQFMETYDPQAEYTDVLAREDHILQPYDISRLPKLLFEDNQLRARLFPTL